MDKDLKKVVVLLAHPNMENSQANKALLDAIKDIEDVAIFNLYEMLEQDILNMDAWSRIISHANAVVYQFPFYWMSAPSLLKKWQDGIFTYLAKTPAVAGKPLLVVTTTGSEFDAYRSGGRNRFTVDELLRPYQGGAVHAGMIWQRLLRMRSDTTGLCSAHAHMMEAFSHQWRISYTISRQRHIRIVRLPSWKMVHGLLQQHAR